MTCTTQQIDQAQQKTARQDKGADRDQHIQVAPLHAVVIGIDASGHALQTQLMHRKKSQVKTEKN